MELSRITSLVLRLWMVMDGVPGFLGDNVRVTEYLGSVESFVGGDWLSRRCVRIADHLSQAKDKITMYRTQSG